MQTDIKTFHVKCLLEGSLFKELGEEEYALQVSKGDNFCNFMFTFIDNKSLLKGVNSKRKEFAP